jgi:carnitine-CoA ligase
VAAHLSNLGAAPGQVVPMLMENSIEFVETVLAVNALGAVSAPLNTGLHGKILAGLLQRCSARVIVIDCSLLANLISAVDALEVEPTVVEIGAPEGQPSSAGKQTALRVVPYTSGTVWLPPFTAPADPPSSGVIGQLLFTSGTTALLPSACMISNGYMVTQGRTLADWLQLREDDVLYAALPMFHVAAGKMLTAAMLTGSQFCPGQRFDPSQFWANISSVGGTVFPYVGATLTELWKRPPQHDDRENSARLGFGAPVPAFASEFEGRFGLGLAGGYGSTEVVTVAFNRPPAVPGRCVGMPRDGLQVIIADEHDRLVAPGVVGEILIRPTRPEQMASGYFQEPARTLQRFRNLWFHSGDLGWMDENGLLYYHGRAGDAIRRKGENISPIQVEDALISLPYIEECAVYAVEGEHGDDEVMAAVRLSVGALVDEHAIWADSRSLLPHYMVPRFIRLTDDPLPQSASKKISKIELVKAGVTDDTWDSLAATVSESAGFA